jgi:opacity protein-like surface antigen
MIQPFLKSSTGFMYLDNPFPDDRGIKLNFVFEVGTGVEILLTDFSSLTLGYKYHHMSNGEIGQVNPGVDSNIIYGALTFF